MQLQTFIAESAMEAVNQIRESLGPDAVVVNVRQLPGNGLARLWSKPRVEVLAYCPVEPGTPTPDSITELRQELAALKDELESRTLQTPPTKDVSKSIDISKATPFSNTQFPYCSNSPTPSRAEPPEARIETTLTKNLSVRPSAKPSLASEDPWRIGALLESTGLLPLYAQQVVEKLRARHGNTPPESLSEELNLARAVLKEAWREAPVSHTNTHVFIGSAGVGKTTCLCQWLTRAALVEGLPTRVWRLDGRSANHAETLSVYAEILGVPMERHLPETAPNSSEHVFVDLPGVNWTDSFALQQLATQLTQLPNPQVHLVLNAAYETSVLLAQARAFGSLPITDLILTHLDEEPRWGKLWNLIFGTKYTIGCLNAGQNIPGDFHPASAEKILTRQFPRK